LPGGRVLRVRLQRGEPLRFGAPAEAFLRIPDACVDVTSSGGALRGPQSNSAPREEGDGDSPEQRFESSFHGSCYDLRRRDGNGCDCGNGRRDRLLQVVPSDQQISLYDHVRAQGGRCTGLPAETTALD